MSESIVYRKIRRGDAFAVLFVLLAAVLAYALLGSSLGSGGEYAAVTYGDKSLRYPLSQDRQILVENNRISLTVVIEDGAVYVRDAGCRDKICEKSGKISSRGSVICLPAGVVIRISGEGDVDIVAG